MKSLLIEEKDKKISDWIEKFLIKIWPQIYAIINGAITIFFTTIVRIFHLIFEQLGFKK